MKIKLAFFIIALAAISFAACSQKGGSNNFSGKLSLNNELDTFSYSVGYNIGESLKKGGAEELNMETFTYGINQALKGDSAQINQALIMQVIRNYFNKKQLVKLEKNKKEGEKFLAENKKKDGVITLKSGLQYKIIKKGTGPIPTDSSTVKVNYKGTLIDGTVFDSSYDHGKPAVFKANQVIKGWTEIIQLMPVGSKYEVYIPTELAYGTNVRPGGKIEPDMALIFEIELLDIVKPTK